MVHVIPTLAMRLIAPIFLRPFFFILQLSESETDKLCLDGFKLH